MIGKIGEYSKEDGKNLIKLARESIAEGFGGKKPKIPEGRQFKQARGVFVTLTIGEKLQGCIGFPQPTLPLGEAVVEAAKSAAFSDPRFFPIKKDELDKIEIEISILTLPQKCNAKDVKTGKDGLIVEYVGYNGLLLPQVATEHQMDRMQFLECVCEKAGLPKDSWQNDNCKLFKFQAQIFKESKER